MKYQIEYEFELNYKGSKGATHQDIIDCITEDAEIAIKNAIDNIISGAEKISYKVTRL